MGGIKNKLTKKLSKFLPLDRKGGRRSLPDEVSNNNGSRLPSFSQPSEMPDGQISDTRKPSHLGLYASKTIGSLRPTSQNLPLTKKTTNKGSLSLKGAQDPVGFQSVDSIG